MRFARSVFRVAGWWGIATVTPLYFLMEAAARQRGVPITYAHLIYGFIGVTLAWQAAFLVIATDPVRYRPLMIPCLIEKFSYVIALAVLYAQSRVLGVDALTAVPDGTLGVLFFIAYLRTSRSA